MIYCDFKKLVFMCSELLHNSYLVSALSFSCCHSSIFVFIRSPSLPFQALSLHFYYCRPSRVCFSVYHRHFSHDEAHVLRSCQPVSGLSYSDYSLKTTQRTGAQSRLKCVGPSYLSFYLFHNLLCKSEVD